MLSSAARQAITIAKTIKAQQSMTLTPENILAARQGADTGNPFEMPADIQLKIVNTDTVHGEFYLLPTHQSTVLMFLHGGAYMTGTVKSRRQLAVNLAQQCGYDTFAVDYRQYPEAKHPAAQQDVEAAYDYLQSHYDHVVIFGESAGASLALSLTLSLLSKGKRLPAKVSVFSPVILQLNVLTSEFTRQERDPMLLGAGEPVQYFDEPASQSPLVSAIYGDYHGFPPLQINCGTEEVKYDDAVILNDICQKAGVSVSFKAWRDLFHVFVLFDMPESRLALQQIGAFLKVA
ncbi:alpha/beta hydrolase [Lactiplantibacillus fabifermentans]|uniref:Alpha/beta hydrolase fold-3 domain-containing protein n=2 Tax=Lactiplantibacillus fabifermentans TaxID=483011 RepID=A0A0R2NQK9_9LACO|nr:alpha/beta hydrolase [Lactiplantibacillus fabifermentans]ETY72517.1 Lipolytic enzyme [Lactiplantibacillus fabifermentans T30PCM01]KRO28001.1 hypothetical protein DY78_GL002737 [Lactiplantibacillus fabifermentans DSM 21115]